MTKPERPFPTGLYDRRQSKIHAKVEEARESLKERNLWPALRVRADLRVSSAHQVGMGRAQ
jgi:hypothetical protein